MAGTKANKTSFKKGHKGGPGRPPRKAEETALAIFKKKVNKTRVANILEKVLELAEVGEPWAVKLLFDRILPETYVAKDVTGGEAGDNPVVSAFRDLVENRKGE